MTEPYSFDNRLIGITINVTKDNYIEKMLKFNGIYYRTDQDISINDHIIITEINGNKLSIKKLNNKKGIKLCLD